MPRHGREEPYDPKPKADVAKIDTDGVKLYIGNLDFRVSCFARPCDEATENAVLLGERDARWVTLR